MYRVDDSILGTRVLAMRLIELHKALANDTRIDIMRWLSDPEKNFRPHKDGKGFSDGVCAKVIQEKTRMSQSTVSHYMSVLQRADLVIATRLGKWTYYKRNNDTIRAFLSELQLSL
jgi:DNA-binding transcriptional ArsR family regulator